MKAEHPSQCVCLEHCQCRRQPGFFISITFLHLLYTCLTHGGGQQLPCLTYTLPRPRIDVFEFFQMVFLFLLIAGFCLFCGLFVNLASSRAPQPGAQPVSPRLPRGPDGDGAPDVNSPLPIPLAPISSAAHILRPPKRILWGQSAGGPAMPANARSARVTNVFESSHLRDLALPSIGFSILTRAGDMLSCELNWKMNSWLHFNTESVHHALSEETLPEQESKVTMKSRDTFRLLADQRCCRRSRSLSLFSASSFFLLLVQGIIFSITLLGDICLLSM